MAGATPAGFAADLPAPCERSVCGPARQCRHRAGSSPRPTLESRSCRRSSRPATCARRLRFAIRLGLFADRLAALFLLEQVGDDVATRSQPDLVALDVGDKATRNVVVVLLMRDAAVGADQLDPAVLDPVDRPDVHAVGADHFHMLTNVLEAAHKPSPWMGTGTQRFVSSAGSPAPRRLRS